MTKEDLFGINHFENEQDNRELYSTAVEAYTLWSIHKYLDKNGYKFTEFTGAVMNGVGFRMISTENMKLHMEDNKEKYSITIEYAPQHECLVSSIEMLYSCMSNINSEMRSPETIAPTDSFTEYEGKTTRLLIREELNSYVVNFYSKIPRAKPFLSFEVQKKVDQ
jgi:hypothetical protein